MTSDIRNREWLNEYPSLKQVNSITPFTVPEGYFVELEGRIISGVRLSELAEKSLQHFAVPDGYFEELSRNIVSRINIEEKIKADPGFSVLQNYFEDMAKQISSRIAIEESLDADEQSFTVPQGYFVDMAQQINSRIAIEESLHADEQNFTVPQGYFEDMAQQINSRIAVEEALATETPSPFTVPVNYFEDLNKSILERTTALENENRRGVVRKLMASTVFKYATAACFTLIAGAAIFTQLNTAPSHDNTYLHKALSNVPDNAIENYLELHMDATDADNNIDKTDQGTLNNVSEADLADYLNNI